MKTMDKFWVNSYKDFPYSTFTLHEGGLCCPNKYVDDCILCNKIKVSDSTEFNYQECNTNSNFEEPNYRGKLKFHSVNLSFVI